MVSAQYRFETENNIWNTSVQLTDPFLFITSISKDSGYIKFVTCLTKFYAVTSYFEPYRNNTGFTVFNAAVKHQVSGP